MMSGSSAWPGLKCAMRHAATTVCQLRTAAIFRQPSILRNLICPLATSLNSRTSAASSFGGILREVAQSHSCYAGSSTGPWERKERELLAAFPQARDHPRAANATLGITEVRGGGGRVADPGKRLSRQSAAAASRYPRRANPVLGCGIPMRVDRRSLRRRGRTSLKWTTIGGMNVLGCVTTHPE